MISSTSKDYPSVCAVYQINESNSDIFYIPRDKSWSKLNGLMKGTNSFNFKDSLKNEYYAFYRENCLVIRQYTKSGIEAILTDDGGELGIQLCKPKDKTQERIQSLVSALLSCVKESSSSEKCSSLTSASTSSTSSSSSSLTLSTSSKVSHQDIIQTSSLSQLAKKLIFLFSTFRQSWFSDKYISSTSFLFSTFLERIQYSSSCESRSISSDPSKCSKVSVKDDVPPKIINQPKLTWERMWEFVFLFSTYPDWNQLKNVNKYLQKIAFTHSIITSLFEHNQLNNKTREWLILNREKFLFSNRMERLDLNLSNIKLSLDELFPFLNECTNLKELTISDLQTSSFWESIFKNLSKKLIFLDLKDCYVQLPAVSLFPPTLKSLKLPPPEFLKSKEKFDDYIFQLKNLSCLKSLSICGSSIKNSTLKQLPDLTELSISSADITDEGLSLLSESITTLHLIYCEKITNKGLQALPENITSLTLNLCVKINDEGIRRLSGKKITSLTLVDPNIKDLGCLPSHLHSFTLSRYKQFGVTRDFIEENMDKLPPQLIYFKICIEPKCSSSAIKEQIKNRLPKCQVVPMIYIEGTDFRDTDGDNIVKKLGVITIKK